MLHVTMAKTDLQVRGALRLSAFRIYAIDFVLCAGDCYNDKEASTLCLRYACHQCRDEFLQLAVIYYASVSIKASIRKRLTRKATKKNTTAPIATWWHCWERNDV